jgi:hypothetical protein
MRVPFLVKLLLFPVAAVWVLRWKIAGIVAAWWVCSWWWSRTF